MDTHVLSSCQDVIEDICALNWEALSREDVEAVATAYHFFSIQFRENLQIACELFPGDPKLAQLRREECDTSNLSPWPGVAVPGERMNHDEFMRRTIGLSPAGDELMARVEVLGKSYLDRVRGEDRDVRALTIASYEDGGLEAVFKAILRARAWDGELLAAFRHFLTEHIRFDSDPDQGHGALSRHLVPDMRIRPIWQAFRTLLIGAVPKLAS